MSNEITGVAGNAYPPIDGITTKILVTYGKFIAVEPMPKNSVQSEKKNGVSFLSQNVQLTKLKVVIPGLSLNEGDFVYVTSDCALQHWAKKVFTLNNKEFILVPEDHLTLVEKTIFTFSSPLALSGTTY